MRLAVGIPCPECGHQEANVLEFIEDEFHNLTAFRLHCDRCATVYVESREPTSEEDALRRLVALSNAIGWS